MVIMVTARERYVVEYYEKNYVSVLREWIDEETRIHGKFLAAYVKGKTLDFGCGPSMHFNALFMANASSIDGIDAVPENIAFTRQKIASFNPNEYRVVEEFMRKMKDDYSLEQQLRKIGRLIVADFTKPLPKVLEKSSYDCVVSTYSIGCVKTVTQYQAALKNAFELLKSGGFLLCLNTDGRNTNNIIPEMTCQGIDQGAALLTRYAKKIGFRDITKEKVKIAQSPDTMYKYSSLLLTTAKR